MVIDGNCATVNISDLCPGLNLAQVQRVTVTVFAPVACAIAATSSSPGYQRN
jgi:hypothetical protein